MARTDLGLDLELSVTDNGPLDLIQSELELSGRDDMSAERCVAESCYGDGVD